MSEPAMAVLATTVFGVAVLYASVGHGGATGYIAVMSLAGVASDTIRPTALVLNVLVSALATLQYARAGHLRLSLLLPLVVASIPAAALGGTLQLPTEVFEGVVAVVLLVSAWRMVSGREPTEGPPVAIAQTWAFPIVVGGLLGLLSGLTGVGGGVFLTPVLLACAVAPVKTVAATSAPFILVNSIAGLTGWLVAGHSLPPVAPWMLLAAGLGGACGATLGAQGLPADTLRRLMAIVLLVAGVKLLLPLVTSPNRGPAAAVHDDEGRPPELAPSPGGIRPRSSPAKN